VASIRANPQRSLGEIPKFSAFFKSNDSHLKNESLLQDVSLYNARGINVALLLSDQPYMYGWFDMFLDIF